MTRRTDPGHLAATVSENFPPFHVTDDDIEHTLDLQRLKVDVIVAHQVLRGWDGRIAVM